MNAANVNELRCKNCRSQTNNQMNPFAFERDRHLLKAKEKRKQDETNERKQFDCIQN